MAPIKKTSFSQNELQTPVGLSIEFRDIKMIVKDRISGASLELLKGISGRVEANRLTVIMGSSGAGKTTLLDVLACNTFGGGTVTGEVLVNGALRRKSDFTQISSYVLQRDVLLASSTVRESILIAAQLKLPRSMSYQQKVERVDEILRELELEGCQHTLIGDEILQIKGISGGQRRRVSVGIELVKSPRVLFLDEPTSGLDSEMAVSLIDTLVNLARQNRTICTTIHQPNSLITSKFGDFMLLHAGSVAYFGPWTGAVDYFAAAGCPCPQYVNPSDFFMSVLKEKGDDLVAAWAKQEQQGRLCATDLEAASDGKEALLLGAATEAAAGQEGTAEGAEAAGNAGLQVEPKVPWWYQVSVLSERMLKMWFRNPAMFWSELSQYIFVGLFIGLVYLQISNSLATGVNDRAASMWFAMAVLSFTPSYTAVVLWDKDRLLLRRESQQGMYSVTAWFAARTATVTPVQVLQTSLFCVLMYFMVGYVTDFVNFLVFLVAFCLFQLISETIGVMCSIATKRSTYAVLILTFILLFLLSFSGFLVSDIPVYFKWISKVSYLTYAYAAVMENEFDGVTFYTADGEPVPGSEVFSGSVADVSLVGVDNGLSISANLGILASIYVASRFLAFLLLFGMAKRKWL